ncbi:MAG: amidohydrolase family protein [Promethearchaeota archaeon]
MSQGIIDFHCHLKNGGVDYLESLKKKYNVECFILHPAFKDFNELSKYHDTVSRILEQEPDEFKAFIGIDFSKDPDVIIEDFHMVGASGIKIHPLIQGISIHDKNFMAPFMSVLKSLKAPVYVHTDHPGVPDYRKYRTLLKSRFGRFAKHFPDHDVLIMGHAGNSDSYLDAKEVLKFRINVYVETSLAPVPSEFEKMVKMVPDGENRLLFGSNEPYSAFQVEFKKIEVLSLSNVQKRKILYENARRLLRL